MKKISVFEMHPTQIVHRSVRMSGNDPLPALTVTVEAGASYQDVAERLRRLAAVFERQAG